MNGINPFLAGRYPSCSSGQEEQLNSVSSVGGVHTVAAVEVSGWDLKKKGIMDRIHSWQKTIDFFLCFILHLNAYSNIVNWVSEVVLENFKDTFGSL